MQSKNSFLVTCQGKQHVDKQTGEFLAGYFSQPGAELRGKLTL